MSQAVKPNFRVALAAGAGVILLAVMAVDTKVVKVGSTADVQSDVFLPTTFGTKAFPKVRAYVESHAVDAATVAAALAKDQDAAGKQYGIAADAGPEIPVKFTGKVGSQDSGVYTVAVPGIPNTVQVTVQTGPAISGTDLRDASGAITFGQFRNQIEYQNAGSALNKEMKQQVLSKLDTSNLTGKTISVVGVFQLTDMATWLVTPVQLDVQ